MTTQTTQTNAETINRIYFFEAYRLDYFGEPFRGCGTFCGYFTTIKEAESFIDPPARRRGDNGNREPDAPEYWQLTKFAYTGAPKIKRGTRTAETTAIFKATPELWVDAAILEEIYYF